MRILYVEDNEVNQALVERVLRAKKCSVVFREEGEGALEILANEPEIDLILLDIELAGSMNGLDVIRAMRARNDHRPVVAITAYAMMGDRERFLEAGCDQYLPKPLVITDLLNLIDDYEAQFARQSDSPRSTVRTVPAPAAVPSEAPAPVAPVSPAAAVPATPIPAASNGSATTTPAATAPAAEQTPARATTPALMPAVKPRSEPAASSSEAVSPGTPAPAAENPPTNNSSTKDVTV